MVLNYQVVSMVIGGAGKGGDGQVPFPNIPDLYWHLLLPSTNVTTIGPTGLIFAGGGAGGPGAPGYDCW